MYSVRKITNIVTDVRVNALLCCGTAVLLSACGGSSSMPGEKESPAPAAPSRTLATISAAAPIVTFSPAVLDFGVVAVGTTSAVKVVTIKNTGTANLSFPSDFRVADSRFKFGGAGNCATNVNYAPGASCTASLVYTPTTTTAVTGSMTVTSNASTTPKLLSLKAGPGSTTSPNNLYVATTGSDANPGTSASPFRTISKAATVAKPGYQVHVADGTYRENVITSTSGTASSYITYISDNRWGAKIVAPGTGYTAAWHNKGDYVAIVGFDITGGGAVGINNSGNSDINRQNRVHHIPAAKCDGYGGTGIGFDQYNVKSGGIADSNVVHNIGPLGTNCFRVQGIYTSIPGVTISNNIIYKVVGYGVVNGHCSHSAKVLNNTIFNNGGPVEGGGIIMAGNTNCTLASKGNVVANNIVYDNVIGVHEERVTAADVTTYTNNLVFGNKINWGAMRMPHSNDVSANPAFVNYLKDGGGDYRLRSGSPAIGKGSATYAAPLDFLGNVRGSTVDIGAYEF